MKNELIKKIKANITVKSLRGIFNLHDPKNTIFYVAIGLIAIFILSMIIRKNLIGATNADYQIFVSWYDYVKAHGLHSFATDFSNYNPPYTYFLYLITLLPVAKIVAIKGLMIVFDLLMAYGVYLVVKQIQPKQFLAVIAGIGSLLLPTVLATGVFWGQFDQFYMAFILFSLYHLLKNNSKLAWLFFGIAIAIKLQAVFFLPVLILMSFKRIKMWHAVFGLAAFTVVTFLPIFAGRSIESILNIYVAQTSLFSGNLVLNAANIYQWVPNSAFELLNSAGIYLTMAFLAGLFIVTLLYKKYSDKDIALLSVITLFIIPFLLPQMHDRYFFTATVASFVLAFVIPRLAWVAIAMQITVLFSYVPFLFSQQPPVSFAVLALVNGVIAVYLIVEYLHPSKDKGGVVASLKNRLAR